MTDRITLPEYARRHGRAASTVRRYLERYPDWAATWVERLGRDWLIHPEAPDPAGPVGRPAKNAGG